MKNIIFAVILSYLLPFAAFSQVELSSDSLTTINFSSKKKLPEFHYSAGSNFTYIPRFGSVSGINASAFMNYPLSPKLILEGGFIAGRNYLNLKNGFSEGLSNNSFNTLSVYGSATYKLNQRLSIYGTGIRQLSGDIPLYYLPKSSYSFGSTINFGSISIGAEIRVNDMNNYFSPFPAVGNRSYFPSQVW